MSSTDETTPAAGPESTMPVAEQVPYPSAPAPAPATEPAPAPIQPVLERRAGRTGTVLWGLIVLVIGVSVLLRAAGAHLDMQLIAIILIGAAGLAMLVNALRGGRSRDRS